MFPPGFSHVGSRFNSGFVFLLARARTDSSLHAEPIDSGTSVPLHLLFPVTVFHFVRSRFSVLIICCRCLFDLLAAWCLHYIVDPVLLLLPSAFRLC
jgi:hypothetical protein